MHMIEIIPVEIYPYEYAILYLFQGIKFINIKNKPISFPIGKNAITIKTKPFECLSQCKIAIDKVPEKDSISVKIYKKNNEQETNIDELIIPLYSKAEINVGKEKIKIEFFPAPKINY